MKLYYMETMNPRKACATAKHLQVPVDFVRIPVEQGGLTAPEYLAINPNGKAPTLVDGDTKLWESAAIAVYLAQRAGSDMWPTDRPRDQVEVMRWISWDSCHWAPTVGAFYFEHIIKPMLGMGAPDVDALEAKLPVFHSLAGILDDHLAGRTHVACDHLTVADFCVGAMLPDWERQGMPLDDYRHIRAWHERLMALPAWQNPWPEPKRA